jgi:hypothetical protein
MKPWHVHWLFHLKIPTVHNQMSQQEATDSGDLVKARCREEPPPFRVIVAQWVKLQVWVDKNIRETKTASYCTFSNYSPFFFLAQISLFVK